MSESKKLMIIGPKSFGNYSFECKYESVSILYDESFDSCKISINQPKFTKAIPTQGAFSPEEMDIAATCLASLLEEFVDRELAQQVLGAYSRFMISNPIQQRDALHRRGDK